MGKHTLIYRIDNKLKNKLQCGAGTSNDQRDFVVRKGHNQSNAYAIPVIFGLKNGMSMVQEGKIWQNACRIDLG